MDFIGNCCKKLKKCLKYRGLKGTLAAYIAVGVLLFAFYCFVSADIFEYGKYLIIEADSNGGTEVVYSNHNIYISGSEPSDSVKEKIYRLEIWEYAAKVLCGILIIWLVSHLYYKRILEEPLSILQNEIECLSRDDISFDCSYVCGNEMGQVCQGFNQMRLSLLENKRNLWELMESQRQLNAAFAHDIRTPLTVMRGYTQMLLKFGQNGQISREKLVETLQTLDNQIGRLERFSYTMKKIHTMEEWKVNKKKIEGKEFYAAVQESLEGLATEKVDIIIKNRTSLEFLICDQSLILEVVDNLAANALRYARKEIHVELEQERGQLYVYFKDDGPGFSNDSLEKAMRPYFTTSEEHYGLGLAICRTLCKKHGGSLELMNSIEGGAIVCASFYVL